MLSWNQIALLIAPWLLLATTYPVYQFLDRRFGKKGGLSRRLPVLLDRVNHWHCWDREGLSACFIAFLRLSGTPNGSEHSVSCGHGSRTTRGEFSGRPSRIS